MENSRDWMTRANCRDNDDVDPGIFFLPQQLDADLEAWEDIDETDPKIAAQIALAKKACGQCIVRKQCLEYALEQGSSSGRNVIWGGMTYVERSDIQIRRLLGEDIESEPIS